MKYHFKLHNDPDSLWAECIELPSCHSQADTISDLEFYMQEVLNLLLDEPSDSTIIFPYPDASLDSDDSLVQVEVEPSIAFKLLLRQRRIEKGWSRLDIQFKSGIKPKRYLEIENTGNPCLSEIVGIIDAFPDLPIMDCFKVPVLSHEVLKAIARLKGMRLYLRLVCRMLIIKIIDLQWNAQF
jgi:predicted RNase H-like HicB family nuclease